MDCVYSEKYQDINGFTRIQWRIAAQKETTRQSGSNLPRKAVRVEQVPAIRTDLFKALPRGPLSKTIRLSRGDTWTKSKRISTGCVAHKSDKRCEMNSKALPSRGDGDGGASAVKAPHTPDSSFWKLLNGEKYLIGTRLFMLSSALLPRLEDS